MEDTGFISEEYEMNLTDEQNVAQVSNHYMRVVADSQWFANLTQILNYAITKPDKYLEVTIRNSIEKGYEMAKP